MTELNGGTKVATVQDLSHVIEYIATAIRALAEGYPADHHMVTEPISWAKGRLFDISLVPIEGHSTLSK